MEDGGKVIPVTLEKDPDDLHESTAPDLTTEQSARSLRFRERSYAVLSSEEKDRLLSYLKEWQQEGSCQPKMEPSLLGLDWSLFETRKFAQDAHDSQLLYPAEFVSIGFSTLDCYATAILATHLPFSSLGLLTFTCKLTHHDPESQMRLEFTTTPAQGLIDLDPVKDELMRSFPELLHAKNIESVTGLFHEGEGCMMDFEYPGCMLASASPFLRDRPLDLWPQAILNLMPTIEVTRRARDIVDFILDSAPIEGNPS
jgi:hypothetical protein